MFGLAVPPAKFAVPSPKLQLKEYGVVPPEAEAVKLTGTPTVPIVGAVVNDTANARGAIVIVAEADAFAPLASVAFTFTVNVPFAV